MAKAPVRRREAGVDQQEVGVRSEASSMGRGNRRFSRTLWSGWDYITAALSNPQLTALRFQQQRTDRDATAIRVLATETRRARYPIGMSARMITDDVT